MDANYNTLVELSYFTLSLQIDGCYDFYVNADDIKLGYRKYGTWGRLVISANVTEGETGMKCTMFVCQSIRCER